MRSNEPERVGDRRAQRPDLEAAAPIGGEAVRGARLLAGVQRREQEARGAAAAVERVVDRERRPCGRVATTTMSTRPCTPTCSRSFSSRAARAAAASRKRTHTNADEQRQGGGDREHRQLHEPEDAPGDEEPDRGSDERPPPAGDHRRQRPLGRRARAPMSRIDASTSAALTPRVMASDDSMSRCSSTDGASSFTSSGTTYERPMLAASARDARCRPSAPRGLTPSRRSRWWRVASTMSTM